jgi:hypothetical protein
MELVSQSASFFFKLKEISLLKKRNEAQLWKEKKTEKDKTEI